MNTKDQSITIERLAKMDDTKKLNFDLKIQRSEGIWDKKRRSKLLHSVIINWPIGQVYATKDNTVYGIIDGKQRCTNILGYISDKYALDASTPPVGDIEVANKRFSELPSELQQAIMSYELKFTTLENATMDEKEEFFKRINAGMPLRPIETTRALLGGKELKLVEDIANTPFFANTLKLNKMRYTDQELVLQILSLIHNENTGFSGKEIENFVIELRKTKRLTDELRNRMANASYFLNLAFLKREPFLKKVNIPMIFVQVLNVQDRAVNISKEEFHDWAKEFFANVPEEYDKAIKEGSGKAPSVRKRLEVMTNHFNDYLVRLESKKKEEAEKEKAEREAAEKKEAELAAAEKEAAQKSDKRKNQSPKGGTSEGTEPKDVTA